MNGVLLSRYVQILRTRWQWVAAVVLAFVGTTAAALLVHPHTYTSTSAVLVSTPRDDADTYYRGDLYARERLPSYIALMQSEKLAQQVIDDLDLSTDPTTLISGTKATAVPDTALIQITTVSESPELAQQTNKAFADALTAEVHELESIPGALTPRAELINVQPSTWPTSPSGVSPAFVLAVAAAVGLIGGCALAVMLTLLDTRVRTAGEFSEAVDADTLADFTAERACAEPGEVFRLLRERLNTLIPQEGTIGKGCRVVLLTSSEQQVGKTSVALGLARAARDGGERVALVDMDVRFSDLAETTQCDAPVTLTDVVADHVSPQDVRLNNFENLTLVPVGSPSSKPGQLIDSSRIPLLLDHLRVVCDWIIIDCAESSHFSDALRLARYAGATLVVARSGKSKFSALQQIRIQFRQAGFLIVGGVLTAARDPQQVSKSTAPPGERRHRQSLHSRSERAR